MRSFIGIALLAASLALTIYLTGVMLYRTARIVERSGYMRVFRAEMAVCACGLFLGLDATFGPISSPIGWLPRLGALAALLTVLALSALILRHMADNDGGDVEYILVPGLALERGAPIKELRFRIDAAFDAALLHPGATLIVTGGNAEQGQLTEAEIMRDILVSKGIEPWRVRVENRSRDTIANFANVARMVDPSRPALLVTSGYHMLRAAGLARTSGFEQLRRRSAKCDMRWLPANVVWEAVCEADNLLKRRVPLKTLFM